jgi:hypothetical protein
MLIPDPVFLSSWIPDPTTTTTTKENRRKDFFFLHFLTKFKIILFLKRYRQFFHLIQNSSIFNQKVVTVLSELLVWDP